MCCKVTLDINYFAHVSYIWSIVALNFVAGMMHRNFCRYCTNIKYNEFFSLIDQRYNILQRFKYIAEKDIPVENLKNCTIFTYIHKTLCKYFKIYIRIKNVDTIFSDKVSLVYLW